MLLYHGTDKICAELIKTKGFKAGDCSDYGKAVYFSDNLETAISYGTHIVTAKFTGKLLNLQMPKHFEIYKKYPNREITKIGYDGLKDNDIIAIYNKRKINITGLQHQ